MRLGALDQGRGLRRWASRWRACRCIRGWAPCCSPRARWMPCPWRLSSRPCCRSVICCATAPHPAIRTCVRGWSCCAAPEARMARIAVRSSACNVAPARSSRRCRGSPLLRRSSRRWCPSRWAHCSHSAFPIASASEREGTQGRYLLANGRGASFAHASSLARAPFIVAAALDDRDREARIDLAAPLSLDAARAAIRRPHRDAGELRLGYGAKPP